MGVERRRPVLADITHGRNLALKRSMACEEADFDIPVVDPAELSKLGEKKTVPFSVSQMVALGEMRGTNDQWRKLVQTLSDREGTVIDVTEDILGYHDQASLTEARQVHADIEATHVCAALRGNASWPTFVRVESWLRDGIMAEQVPRHRAAALRLWSICLASVAGPEALRKVVEATTEWVTYDVKDAQCSGRGSDMIATVAWKRALLYSDWLWTGVMFAVDRASAEVLWDWRKTERACYTHAHVDCPNGLGGKEGMEEMPHQDMVPGGYSGNVWSLADVSDETGLHDDGPGQLGMDSDSESGDEGGDLIDFEVHQNRVMK